jgi:RIO kinase 1
MTHDLPPGFLDPASPDPLVDLDERFVFDYAGYDDDLAPGQRWSPWDDLEALMKGPEPRPDWVVTSSGALKRKSTWGRIVAAGEWATSEWGALRRLWELGVPVPYPVQIDETEIMMEWITHTVDGEVETAPRLAQVRPDRELLGSYYEQLRDALGTMAQAGVVHGDLSPYNTLAAGDRLVIIDLPQIVDLVGNPQGMDFLLRDCANMCRWFRGRGLEVDEQELFADLMAHAF